MITAYGTPITIAEKDVLDCFSSDWTLDSGRTPGATLNFYKSYAMDGNDPLAFWLWPRGVADTGVIVTFAGIPIPVTAISQVLTLADVYVPDIVDYVAYRALSKESRAGAKQLAEFFLNRFLTRLGAQRQIVKQIGQNASRPPNAEA